LSPGRATFYFDLGSPYAYLSAERISGIFTDAELEQPEWQPILLGGLFRELGRDSWGNGPERAEGMAEVERRAAAYGLPPLRWPADWPPNTLAAMRAAVWADREGRGAPFARAAFRRAFAEGADLADPRVLADIAAAVGLDGTGLASAIAARDVKDDLRARTEAALDLGVRGVPTLAIGDRLLYGDDRLDEASGLRPS